DETSVKQPVYVKENGTVYHKAKACSYLTVLMTRIDYDTIKSARNTSGGKYKPCKSCADGKNFSDSDVVYVSKSGTSFHSTPLCKSLIKTVKTMDKEEAAKTRKPCSKCN
ncbi:MAG: hypothetical protein MJ113_05130, partial [Lachnospiraceae bacterium]|nr:hypothetical protein [Lachnospiraceae bacterium]